MLNSIKKMFTHIEDYEGRDVDKVIVKLAARSHTATHVWSYLKEQSVYENTQNGFRLYPHEVHNYAD